MPQKIPAYRQRRGSDQALVTLLDAVTKERRDYWLGLYGTPQSREKYHRLIAEWEANKRVLPDRPMTPNGQPCVVTVEEVIAAYWAWIESYHGYDESKSIRLALRILRHTFGSLPAAEFGPKSLRIVPQAMIGGEIEGIRKLRPWSRPFVNRQIQRITAAFKWAAGQEMIPVTVYQQLKTLEPLRRGKTTAPEPLPVRPVEDALVDPLKKLVSLQVWALNCTETR